VATYFWWGNIFLVPATLHTNLAINMNQCWVMMVCVQPKDMTLVQLRLGDQWGYLFQQEPRDQLARGEDLIPQLQLEDPSHDKLS